MTTSNLTDLNAVKSWLGISGEKSDTILNRLIIACSAEIESRLNRRLLLQDYEEHLIGHGTPTLVLSNAPIVSITELIIDGTPIAAVQNSDHINYRFADQTIRLQGAIFPQNAPVTVRYRAGFEVLPAGLEQAALELIAWRFRNRNLTGLTSASIADQSAGLQSQKIPESIARVIDPWRLVTLPSR